MRPSELTQEQTETYLKRMLELGNEHIPYGLRVLIVAAYRPDDIEALLVIRDALVMFAPREALQELSRLGKGNQPDGECDVCKDRTTCWPEKYTMPPQPIVDRMSTLLSHAHLPAKD